MLLHLSSKTLALSEISDLQMRWMRDPKYWWSWRRVSLSQPLITPLPIPKNTNIVQYRSQLSWKYSINPTEIANYSDRMIQIKENATKSNLVVSSYLTNFILLMQSRNKHIYSMMLSFVSQNMISWNIKFYRLKVQKNHLKLRKI